MKENDLLKKKAKVPKQEAIKLEKENFIEEGIRVEGGKIQILLHCD